MVAIPFFHVTGCFSLLNIALATGTKLVLMRRFEPEACMALIEQERATSIGGRAHHPLAAAGASRARPRYDLSQP